MGLRALSSYLSTYCLTWVSAQVIRDMQVAALKKAQDDTQRRTPISHTELQERLSSLRMGRCSLMSLFSLVFFL